MIIDMHIYSTYSIFIDCWKTIASNGAARLHSANLNQLSANTARC